MPTRVWQPIKEKLEQKKNKQPFFLRLVRGGGAELCMRSGRKVVNWGQLKKAGKTTQLNG